MLEKRSGEGKEVELIKSFIYVIEKMLLRCVCNRSIKEDQNCQLLITKSDIELPNPDWGPTNQASSLAKILLSYLLSLKQFLQLETKLRLSVRSDSNRIYLCTCKV